MIDRFCSSQNVLYLQISFELTSGAELLDWKLLEACRGSESGFE